MAVSERVLSCVKVYGSCDVQLLLEMSLDAGKGIIFSNTEVVVKVEQV